jgi:Pvc16 N-terminal domain
MSNVNAVAVATEGLKALLQRAFAEAAPAAITGATVGAVRPTQIPGDFVGVNVFLYRITPNAALRNDDLPTRRANGEIVRRPQLALDLHYLLTFVGDETALEPQRILGAAAAGLHAHAELTPEDIEEIASNAAVGSYLRAHNDLAQQVERVRFRLEPLTVEELTKLWTMFPQKAYELTIAVQGSVLLLEAPLTPVPHRPVLRRGIYSGLPEAPKLATVAPLLTPRSVEGARSRLTLGGAGLSAEATRVRFDADDPVAAISAEQNRVVVAIPDALRAGIHSARVLVAHRFDSGQDTRRFELESNALPFVLEPRIATPAPIATSVGGTITLAIEPAIAPRQQVRVIVGALSIRWTTPLPGVGVPLEHAEVTVRLPAEIVAGSWPLRIEVDGATSTLIDPPPGAPPTAVPSPHVEVT